ncbi:MAG TPA: hypothetical protein VKF15_02775, partial [Nitrososphaerales archaeon]|nr:hypothetical protein [Nitrososphaerales archaeon]
MKQGKSGRIGLGTVAALLLMSVSLVLFPLSENAHATPTIPSGVQAYVPITLTNSQSSATGSGFQQKLTISWNSYASYLNSGVTNAEFFDGAGNVLKGWCESACSSAAASSIVWVNLGSDVIPASGGILTIYLGFLTTGTNNMGNSGSSVWGEAPQLSSTYGQYDDGANVFQFYDNFAGSALSSAWNTAGASGTFSVSNGLVMDSYQFPGYSLSLNNQYTGPLVLDAYQVSTSGAWLGATFSNLQTTTSSYGITGGAAQEIYPPQGADGLNGVCISSGCTTLVPSPVTTTLQVVTLAVGASSATGYQNYANAVTVSGTISLTNYPGLFQVAWNPTDAQTTTWFRIRAYPPSNTMPTASVGALVGVVTQPITLTIAESGAPSSGSFTVSGCDAQVTTIGASTSGTTTDVVAQTSCSITITAPPPSGNSRYVFAGGAASETFSTCSTGTCPAQPYTVYYQLSNAYQVTAKAQPAFDSGMSWPVTGTIAGSAAQTGCTISSTPSASDSCSAYFDYNLTVTIPQAASSPPANSRWQSSAACPFTTTSGGSTDNCNSFKQWTDRSLYSVTGGGTPSPPELACIEYGNPASSNLTGSFQTYWCDNGGSWSVTNPLAPSGASERWVTSNSTSGVVNSAQTLGFVYHHQYYLTVASAHDTPTGQGWYGAGQAASFAITNATVGGGPGVRHVFAGWSSNDTGGYTGSMASASATMDGPIAETAGWLTEYNVTYASSGCAIPVTLPANEWVVSGGGASGSFSATVNGPPGTRCVFIGDDRPGAITSPTTVTGTYQTQYYLTVVSTHDTPTGQGWYNSSASATFGVTTPVNGSAGTRFVFYGWSSNDTGGYTGS